MRCAARARDFLDSGVLGVLNVGVPDAGVVGVVVALIGGC